MMYKRIPLTGGL